MVNSSQAGERSIDYQISFVLTTTTTPVPLSFFASGIDIDQFTTGNEFVEITRPDAYRTQGGGASNLTITDPSTGVPNGVRFEATSGGGIGGIGDNEENAFTAYFENVNTFTFRAGKTGDASNRFASLYFQDITYTLPADIFITDPIICGTVTDQNGNPIPNVTINLSDGQTTTTDNNGDYQFFVLVYLVRNQQQAS